MENRCFEIKIGQTVYLKPTGNFRRGWKGAAIVGEITRIGRVYFYVQVEGRGVYEERFYLEDFIHDDRDQNAGFIIYESMEAFYKDASYERMLKEIRNFFSGAVNKPTYETVRGIHDLLLNDDTIRFG